MDFRRVGLIGFALFLAAALLHSATAERYTVLGTEGWTIPTTGNDGVYCTWASNKEFKVGDVLVFNFPTGVHDVTEVTKANYDICGKTNSISTVTTGPVNVKLTTTGMHYYICSFGQHCTAGQKLAIKVTTNHDDNTITPATISPPSTKIPTTTTSSSPSPSSASSITFSGFSVAVLSIVLVFFLH